MRGGDGRFTQVFVIDKSIATTKKYDTTMILIQHELADRPGHYLPPPTPTPDRFAPIPPGFLALGEFDSSAFFCH